MRILDLYFLAWNIWDYYLFEKKIEVSQTNTTFRKTKTWSSIKFREEWRMKGFHENESNFFKF